jgi:hypothetical protein
MNQLNRPRMVDGQIVRDSSLQSTFSFRRFLLVLVVTCTLIITNPANQLYDRAMEVVDKVAGNQRTRQRELSDWTWNKLMDPSIVVTNYGVFTVEERHAKVVISALTKSWSCPYFDSRKGSFCSALAKNLCHGNPLLYHPKSYAYTVHRTICFLLVATALLAFCCRGTIPTSLTSEPFLRAILTCLSRNHFSFLSLAMDLVSYSNAA